MLRQDTGKYAKSWATKRSLAKTATLLEMTVHSKNRYQLAHLLGERGMPSVAVVGYPARPHIAPAEENGVQLLEHLIEGALS